MQSPSISSAFAIALTTGAVQLRNGSAHRIRGWTHHWPEQWQAEARRGLHVLASFPSKWTEFLSSTHPCLISPSREVAQLYLESKWHTAISFPCSNVWDLFPWPETNYNLKPQSCAPAPCEGLDWPDSPQISLSSPNSTPLRRASPPKPRVKTSVSLRQTPKAGWASRLY